MMAENSVQQILKPRYVRSVRPLLMNTVGISAKVDGGEFCAEDPMRG